MPNKFSLKESDRMIRDVIDEFFEQHNANYDLKELMKTNLLGNEDNVPVGYHRMPDTGEILPDEEMEQ